MKKLITIILIIQYLQLHAQQWVKQTTPTTNELLHVNFPVDSVGYVSGDVGVFLKTSNAGKSWSKQTSSTGKKRPYFVAADTGFASTDADLYKTVNGGTSWKKVLTAGNPGDDLNAIFDFPTHRVGYVLITSFLDIKLSMYKTIDYGETWSLVKDTTLLEFDGAHFFNDSVGVFLTNNSIWKTYNSGKNWVNKYNDSLAMFGGFTALNFYNDTAGVVLTSGYFLRTTDAGEGWDTIPETWSDPFWAIDFMNADTGFTVGGNGFSSGTIVQTTDGGLNWSLSYSDVRSVNDVCFPSSKVGYAVGQNGLILKYDRLINSLNEIDEANSFVNIYSQNNTGLIKVKRTNSNEKGQLILSDITGKEVTRVENISEPEFSINVNNLSKGLYVYSYIDKSLGVKNGKLFVY